MAGILDFQQFVGGDNIIQLISASPSEKNNRIYTVADADGEPVDITDWELEADFQTIIVDTLAYNRHTGEPNFANSTVVGTFAKEEITGDDAPAIVSASAGTMRVTFPADMYTGPIIPDARQNVPIVVVGFTFTNADTPTAIENHKWGIIQSWEPDVEVGDPTLDAGYTALTVGA